MVGKTKKNTVGPFVKWAGGKTRILGTLSSLLPEQFIGQESVCYVEPFVGGAAMLFHMLTTYPNIKRAIINDINPDLVACYKIVHDDPTPLIEQLKGISDTYYRDIDSREAVYYAFRDEYNAPETTVPIRRAALFIFLNHTCFNGLYRENSNGIYNVPHGKYKAPVICNEEGLWNTHNLLNKVEITILCGDYQKVREYIGDGYCFVYMDPPYRPLLGEKNFNTYNKSGFSDKEQVELKAFCDQLNADGAKWMLSNSDSRNDDGTSYFEQLYDGYDFRLIYAPRMINAFGGGRGKLHESLIRNYRNILD